MCGGRPNTSDRAFLRSGLEYLSRHIRKCGKDGQCLVRCWLPDIAHPMLSVSTLRVATRNSKQPGGLCNEAAPSMVTGDRWAVTYAPSIWEPRFRIWSSI